MTHVKICCISSIQEAQWAINAGASALGLVGPMPSGPGVIDDATIAEITEIVPSHIDTFLLTSEQSAARIIAHHQKVKTTTIQLVDEVEQGAYEKIKMALPDVKLVQVIHVLDEKQIEEAVALAPFVDVILLDSGNPNLSIKELGGTGRVHNWNISQTIVEEINKPVFLAGGLKAGNVQAAIKAVQPYGVDLCSGVRTNGQLDAAKLDAFFKAVNGVKV